MSARVIVWLIFYFYLWLHIDLSRWCELNHSTIWFKLFFICRYICDKFVHAQICTNECFLPNSFSAKEDYFRVYLISSEDKWWIRAPMVSLFLWWVLRNFNLLCHIYIGFTNVSFCERLSYNPFNRTSVLFTIVFLTWYETKSYYIVLPISISALIFQFWSLYFWCIIFLNILFVW